MGVSLLSEEDKIKLREKWRQATARYRVRYPERAKDQSARSTKKWRAKNPDRCRAVKAKWNAENPEKKKLSDARGRKRYYLKNKDKMRRWTREWVDKNRERHNARERRRSAEGHSFRLGKYLRCRMRMVIRRARAKKSASAMALTGCDVEFLMGYLAAKFKPGMTWANYGSVWELDHIIPCSYYDLTDESHQRSCFHFTNLQPLFVTENRQKYNKIPVFIETINPS